MTSGMLNTRFIETKTLVENIASRLEQLEEENKIANARLEKYSRKIEQLQELDNS